MPDRLVIRARPSLVLAAAMLESLGLPAADLTDEHLEHFFFAGPDDAPRGLVGLEICGDDALLRSLAVSESDRGRGLGSALVRRAEDYAAARRVKQIYLLTTTAEDFFSRLGYSRMDRTEAPVSIQRTSEFAGLCPASAVFMVKRLRGSR